MPCCFWQVLSNISQIFEDDAIAPVFDGLLNNAVRDGMQDVFDVAFLPVREAFDGAVRRLRSRLLKPSARVLELSPVVVEFSCVKKAGSAGDSDLVDAEVNTENRSVLGRCFGFSFRRSVAKVDVPAAVAVVECGFGVLPVAARQVLVLVAVVIVWEAEVGVDTTVVSKRRECDFLLIWEDGERPTVERHRVRGELWF